MDLVRLTRDEDDNLIVAATGKPTIPLMTLKSRTIDSLSSPLDLGYSSPQLAIPKKKSEMAEKISGLAIYCQKANAYELNPRGSNFNKYRRDFLFHYMIVFYQINEHQHQEAISSKNEGDKLTVIPE